MRGTGWAGHIGAGVCAMLLLTPLWTADVSATGRLTITVAVIGLHAAVSALVALAQAYGRTSPVPEEDRLRQVIRVAQWITGILCAVDAAVTMYLVSLLYVFTYGDPWRDFQF